MIYSVRVSLDAEFDDVEADSELEAAQIAKDLAFSCGEWKCTVRPKEAADKNERSLTHVES